MAEQVTATVPVDQAAVVADLESRIGTLIGDNARLTSAIVLVGGQHAAVVKVIEAVDVKAGAADLRQAIKDLKGLIAND